MKTESNLKLFVAERCHKKDKEIAFPRVEAPLFSLVFPIIFPTGISHYFRSDETTG